MASSVQDSRVSPNNSRSVQGTSVFDVQPLKSLKQWFDTMFNRNQNTPLDSRATTPTDSRTTSTTPQNSRA